MIHGPYLLFAGSLYYPGGGVDDFIRPYDDLLAALGHGEEFEWAQVAVFDGSAFTMLAEWYPWNAGPGSWWKMGEYPNAQFIKTAQETAAILLDGD